MGTEYCAARWMLMIAAASFSASLDSFDCDLIRDEVDVVVFCLAESHRCQSLRLTRAGPEEQIVRQRPLIHRAIQCFPTRTLPFAIPRWIGMSARIAARISRFRIVRFSVGRSYRQAEAGPGYRG